MPHSQRMCIYGPDLFEPERVCQLPHNCVVYYTTYSLAACIEQGTAEKEHVKKCEMVRLLHNYLERQL
jgi:uncharacterized protein (DUF2062 family)